MLEVYSSRAVEDFLRNVLHSFGSEAELTSLRCSGWFDIGT